MGMDIHLDIFKNKKCIAEDIFNGRNTPWFNNLMENGNDEVYDSLPINCGVSDETSEEWAKLHEDPGSYFGHHYIEVKDFKDWFLEYRPDQDAGWVTTYEKWAYENKNIEPIYLSKELHKGDVIEDMHFIVITKKSDCSAWLYCYLIENNIPNSAVIQYCFDR